MLHTAIKWLHKLHALLLKTPRNKRILTTNITKYQSQTEEGPFLWIYKTYAVTLYLPWHCKVGNTKCPLLWKSHFTCVILKNRKGIQVQQPLKKSSILLYHWYIRTYCHKNLEFQEHTNAQFEIFTALLIETDLVTCGAMFTGNLLLTRRRLLSVFSGWSKTRLTTDDESVKLFQNICTKNYKSTRHHIPENRLQHLKAFTSFFNCPVRKK